MRRTRARLAPVAVALAAAAGLASAALAGPATVPVCQRDGAWDAPLPPFEEFTDSFESGDTSAWAPPGVILSVKGVEDITFAVRLPDGLPAEPVLVLRALLPDGFLYQVL